MINLQGTPSDSASVDASRRTPGSPSAVDRDGVVATEVWPIVERIAKVAAPIVIFGALAYYIGFVRQDALLRHFGLSTSLVDLSPQEYAIRSTDALVRFAVGLSIYCLLLIGAHQLIGTASRYAGGGHTRLVSVISLACGAVATSLGVWRLVRPVTLQGAYLLGPAALSMGVLLITYGVGTIKASDGNWTSPLWMPTLARWVAGTSVATLMVVSLFWAANDYSRAQGAKRAADLEDAVPTLPWVVLYSTIQVTSTASNMVEEELDVGVGSSEYRYRYTGLKLLMRSDDRLFLIPSNWSSMDFPTEPIVLIDDDERVRLEISLP